jgi:pimeloyl-ACP methyl ester carboxylesterase
MLGSAGWLTPALRERYRETWRQGLTGALNYYRASPLRPPTGPADTLHSLLLSDEDFTVRVPTTVLWGEQDQALLPGLLHGWTAGCRTCGSCVCPRPRTGSSTKHRPRDRVDQGLLEA